MILEIHLCFFSKGWGIKHRFSDHMMADISHRFYFYLLCNRWHTQTQQIKIKKRCKSDVRSMRIGDPTIVICLIEREVISVDFVN